MELILEIPDDADLGPAMRELNPSQRAFVFAVVECGGDYTRAAAAAGYGDKGKDQATYVNTIRAAGSRLSRDKKVIAAMREEAERRLQASALMAVEQLKLMALDPHSKHQYKAAVALLDRLGMAPIDRKEITVKHRMTDEQLKASIRDFADKMGLDPAKLLGHNRAVEANITEAEFEPVTGREGLEDLL
ncbi:hypothetical protein UFOVP134_40 [uncultured Caudovirales phage]|uniref:Terminase small subunit n=1 Tax=uncultured Caudovirales phage TaxID=2100421 RepID=A0A6J5LDS5_9CAUD|nr:hypothetical protein UFOVP134_40 [uncultured Caudovirales phage]